MLSYANSDFENGVGNWAPDSSQPSNIATFTTDTTAFLHKHALKAVAAGTGTMIFKLGNGSTNAVQINLPKTGGEYRAGAYFKGPNSVATHTIEFDLGCYDSSNQWLGWQTGTPVALNNNGNWQYIEDDITVAPTCAQVQGSPRVQATGFNVNGILRMDDVIFAPYRAALAIGAHGENCDQCTYTSSEWGSTDQAIGPLQTDKEFNGDLPSTGFSGTNCSGDETQAGKLSQPYPLCIITYTNAVTSQMQMDNFLKTVPAGQQIILVWYQEPEGKTFGNGNTPGCGTDTGATAFKCETQIQATYVHDSAYDTPNILIAQNSAGSKYENGQVGQDCSWITPADPTTGPDLYLVDYYENGTVPANENVNQIPHNNEWQNWLSCASAQNRPLGFGEFGLDNSPNHPAYPYGSNSLCTQSTSNAQNLPGDLTDTGNYLGQLPMSGQAELKNPAPFVTWDYWYSDYGGTPVCTLFDNTNHGVDDWQAIENQNGGPVGG